jgi:hypothetical protein
LEIKSLLLSRFVHSIDSLFMKTMPYSTSMILMVLLMSCKQQSSESMLNNMVGKWTVYYSEIKDMPNQLMNNSYFEFSVDQKVKTNIFGEENTYPFIINESQLLIEAPIPFKMDVTRSSKDTLMVQGLMKNKIENKEVDYDIKLSLARIE